jgi:hypothetical protein
MGRARRGRRQAGPLRSSARLLRDVQGERLAAPGALASRRDRTAESVDVRPAASLANLQRGRRRGVTTAARVAVLQLLLIKPGLTQAQIARQAWDGAGNIRPRLETVRRLIELGWVRKSGAAHFVTMLGSVRFGERSRSARAKT